MGLAAVKTLETGSEQWSNQIRKRARMLARQEDETKLQLAELLYTVSTTTVDGLQHNPPIYTSWGYATFEEYVGHELGLERKKAQALQRVWRTILDTGMDKYTQKRLMLLGWTKARELTRVMTEANALKWIEMAEQTTHPDLVANIQRAIEIAEQKEALNPDGEEEEADPPEVVERMKGMSFALYPEQKMNIELALKRASELANSPAQKRNHHLDLICTDFLATNDFKLGNDPDMKWRVLAKYEQLFGVRLIAVDPVKRRIVFGVDALELCAVDEDGDD